MDELTESKVTNHQSKLTEITEKGTCIAWLSPKSPASRPWFNCATLTPPSLVSIVPESKVLIREGKLQFK